MSKKLLILIPVALVLGHVIYWSSLRRAESDPVLAAAGELSYERDIEAPTGRDYRFKSGKG